MLKKIYTLFLVLISTVITAQIDDLAKVNFEIEKIEEGKYELKAIFDLVDGAWLYGESDGLIQPPALELNIDESKDYSPVGNWVLPEAKSKFIKEFEGNSKYWKGKVIATHKIECSKSDFTVFGNYQAQVCNDEMCVTTPFPNPIFSVEVGKGSAQGSEGSSPVVEKEVSEGNKKPRGDIEYDFSKAECGVKTFNGKSIDEGQSESYWMFFLLAFASGLVALLTPCVFPMIPMTVSFFMNSSGSKKKGKISAIVFGVSIVAIYVGIGVVMNLMAEGTDAANFISTHWIPNILFFTIFIFFAASFFGMFEITLPSKWGNVSDQKADKGGIGGAFFMALTLSIVSFSCTGPIIGNVLVESVSVGGVKPIIGMLGFSLAFALPFTLFAFFPSWLQSMPKSGGWLNSVKVVLGFLELALALKFLSVADQTAHWHILDREVYLALWIAIFSLMGLYLLGKIKFSHDSDLPFLKVPRFLMAVATFAFVVYLLPGMWGAPLKALSGYLPPTSTMDFNLSATANGEKGVSCGVPEYSDELHLPHGLVGYFNYEEGMRCAKEQGKPVFIDFTGHGCVNCRKIEDAVWSDPSVLEILREEFVIISLYIDEHTIELPENQRYISKFDGKTEIVTLGQKNADIEKCWFNKNSQPYYVTFDQQEELLQVPIAYAEAKDKLKFRKFLKNSIKEYKKRD